ncbi:hypothetical protein [Tenuibacillus multivorans]|uniref:hypothetical protein n=1 Tax=Tenuibacillus multivorans TaxID=237069 RepID=UPI000B86CA30|nr:hypothetical protein [Tenuibacillus multivorans]
MNEPKDYEVFKEYPNELYKGHDAIIAFVTTLDEMVDLTKKIVGQKLLNEKGYLFLAYPKKGNKRYDTYIHRDEIFPAMKTKEGYVFDSDVKFAMVVSMDDTYTVFSLKNEKKPAKKSVALNGTGIVWVDGLKFEEVDFNTPTTHIDLEQSLQDEPVNLSFEE